MAGATTIQVMGAAETQAALRALPGRLRRYPIQSALRAAAVIVRNEARKLAPVGPNRLTKHGPLRGGMLKRKIIYKIKSRGATQTAIVQTGTREQMSIPAGSKWYYPAIVEYGATGRNIFPRRFMQQAFDNSKAQALAAFQARLAPEIAKQQAKALAKGIS